MKKLLALTGLLLAFSGLAWSQNGVVKGKLYDTAAKKPVSDATVSVLSVKDSSLTSFVLTDKNGLFEIKNLEPGEYRLQVSHQEFQGFKRVFTLTADKSLADLGEIKVTKQFKTMDEVVVVDDAPVKIKGDTVQFKADAFKTKPNATTEDLLKKIPGMQVDKDGNVTAQGEAVQKVYVDGKEFFGNDPKLATKNITADMVENIQVYDDMSDQAKFTRIDDGSRSKTINITLKKDRRKGYFIRALGAYGTEDRFEGNISANWFNDKQRVSLIANGNNINKSGFSFSDIISNMGGFSGFGGGGGGGGGRGGGGGGFGGGGGNFGGAGMQMISTRGGGFGGLVGTGPTGINTSLSTGVNYNGDWGKKVKASANYFFSRTDNDQEQETFRQTFFPNDSTANLSRTVISNNINQNHRFNMRLEFLLDSMNSILVTPSVTLQHSENFSDDTSFIVSKTPLQQYLAQTSHSVNTNERDGINFNNNLLYRRRFKKAGRTFTLGWTNSYSESESQGYTIAPLVFYKPDGSNNGNRNQNLENNQTTSSNNNTLSTSYTEPVGNNKVLEFNYAYTKNTSTSERETFNYNTATGKYDLINAPLTNKFKNGFESNRFGVNYRLQEKKYNYQIGLGVQTSELTSNTFQLQTGKDSLIRQRFLNFFPTANFTFSPVRSKNIRINYRGRTNQPSVSQLQNVLDVSNPIQYRIGNPELDQEFTHNFNLNYNTFNIATFKFVAASLNFSTTSNKIVNSIDTISRGIQLVKPENVDGSYNAFSFLTLGFPFKNKKLKGSSLNFTTSAAYNRDVSLLYKQKNIGKTLMITQGAGVNFNFKDKLDLGINMSVSYNNLKYSVNTNLNEDYFSQTYSADISYFLPKNFIIATEFDYYLNSGRADGFNQQIPLWHGSLSKQVFKKKNGEIKFSVRDILNQNQSITRNNSDNFIEDVRSMVLRRYFMISFQWNLNKMGGRGNNSNPMNNMPMPRQMRRNMDNMRVNF